MPWEKDQRFRSPTQVKQAMARAMNDTLTGKSSKHYGVLASLGNTWLAAHKLEYELGEWKKLKEEIDELKSRLDDDHARRWKR
jgi:hypothetical protein